MIEIAAVLNYKILDEENEKVSLPKQLIYIFDTMYGGDDEEQIADTIALITRAAILDKLGTYKAADFYQQRGVIEADVFQSVKKSLKEFYISSSSFVMINLEFDSQFQQSVARILAEEQRIVEKKNLLKVVELVTKMNEGLARDDKIISVDKATAQGRVYEAIRNYSMQGTVEYNKNIKTIINDLAIFFGNDLSKMYFFLHILVAYIDCRHSKPPKLPNSFS